MAEPFIGEVRMFGGNFAPVNWAFCDGRLLSIAQYEALYTLIGTTYGGDGQNTFAVPDLRGRLPLHQGTLQGGSTYPIGQLSGTETVTLTGGQIGSHAHSANAGGPANSGSPTAHLLGTTTSARYATTGSGPPLTFDARTVQTAGTSQPHDNMMPYLAISFIIALEGIFPSQG